MGCDGCMKVFLVVFNIIFFLIGSSVLAVGIWVKVDAQHLLDLTKDVSGTDLNDTDIPGLLDSAVLILIVAGGFIFLLGFIGCCGALTFKQKVGKLFLKVYAAIVLIIFILEIAGVAVGYLFFERVEAKLHEFLDHSLTHRYNASFSAASNGGFIYTSNGDPITKAWDLIQLQFHCCGRSNGADYTNQSLYWDSFRFIALTGGSVVNFTVPPSCCAVSGDSKGLIAEVKDGLPSTFSLVDDTCPYSPVNITIAGCYDKIKDTVVENWIFFMAAACTILGVELLCIIFGCCLSRKDMDQVDVMLEKPSNDYDSDEGDF